MKLINTFLAAALLTSAGASHAGFITGAVVGSALSGDSTTTVEKKPGDITFLGNGKDTFVVCTYRNPSQCDERFQTMETRQSTICKEYNNWRRERCIEYHIERKYNLEYYTPEGYAKQHGYTKVLQKGLHFRGDTVYHIMRVEK